MLQNYVQMSPQKAPKRHKSELPTGGAGDCSFSLLVSAVAWTLGASYFVAVPSVGKGAGDAVDWRLRSGLPK